MRTAFINRLIEEARLDETIFLVVGDLGFSVVEKFAEEFPERFLNAGVAEQNMAGVAAGLSTLGYNVFIYSIGNFPTLRCMEQIRNDICYHAANVKIVSVGAGFSYGSLGMSHHATEDVGMMRVLPGLPILSPSDPAEASACTGLLAVQKGPAYLRLGKAGEPAVHPEKLSLRWGEIPLVVEGKETAVLAHGSILFDLKRQILSQKPGWSLYSMPFINRSDPEQIAEITAMHKRLIVLEEHQQQGGLGSVVLEQVNQLVNAKRIRKWPEIVIRAIDGQFLSVSGSQNYLRELLKINIL